MKVRLVIGGTHADEDSTALFVDLPGTPSADDVISVTPADIPADWLEKLKEASSFDQKDRMAFLDLQAKLNTQKVKSIGLRVVSTYNPNWVKDESGAYHLIVAVWPQWTIT